MSSRVKLAGNVFWLQPRQTQSMEIHRSPQSGLNLPFTPDFVCCFSNLLSSLSIHFTSSSSHHLPCPCHNLLDTLAQTKTRLQGLVPPLSYNAKGIRSRAHLNPFPILPLTRSKPTSNYITPNGSKPKRRPPTLERLSQEEGQGTNGAPDR